ncbi:condensin complex protein MksE [Bizionia paragorgiae]|uniref:condensin complex protein MksE n=1 Tax=Bizionia paragorgiae TaxID=283786 RepID=UPI003A8F73DB
MANEHITKTVNNHFADIFKLADVQEHFANLNIELLRGRHIQDDSYYFYRLLSKYYAELKKYYEVFYNLFLDKKTFEGVTYFFLTFNEGSKGVLSSTSRHRDLTPTETIIAITLLQMYYEKYFDNIKEISFQNIKTKIKESEFSQLYKTVFFKNGSRDNFTPKEWANVMKNFKNVINDFEQLGWVDNVVQKGENNFSFTIKESIHRFQTMYEYEILNFEEFANNLNQSNYE